jgi:hypothetical protein
VKDFLDNYPVPDPPPPPVDHAERAKVKTAGSMLLVDRTVCKYDPRNPCGHDHSGPVFRPDPALDEIGVGWTVQHTPRNLNAHKVDQRCVVCWERVPDLREHECQVMVVLNG